MTERVGGPAETQPAEKKGKKRGREGKEGDWGLGRERERERESEEGRMAPERMAEQSGEEIMITLNMNA